MVNLKTKSAGDGYPRKALEKPVLRFLGSRTFSHGRAPKRPVDPAFAQSLTKRERKRDKVARGTSFLVIHQGNPDVFPDDISRCASLVTQTVSQTKPETRQ